MEIGSVERTVLWAEGVDTRARSWVLSVSARMSNNFADVWGVVQFLRTESFEKARVTAAMNGMALSSAQKKKHYQSIF